MGNFIDLASMRARLAELEAEREPLLALIRAAESYESVVGKTLFSSGNITARQRTRPDSAGGRSAPIMVATEKAVSELIELLGPVATVDLASLLKERADLNLPERNAVNVLSARLSNSDKFETRRGSGWWFKGRAWPSDGEGAKQDNEVTQPSLTIS